MRNWTYCGEEKRLFSEILKDCWKREADLAMFSMEQYCQLILKYKLLLLRGFYPKAHSLRRLIRTLGEVRPEVLTLVNDVKNLHYIAKLEEAYISSRYAPIEYEVEEAKNAFDVLKKAAIKPPQIVQLAS